MNTPHQRHQRRIDDHRPATTSDETERYSTWRDQARNVMIVAAFGCVGALGLTTIDAPILIILAVLAIPALWAVYQCVQVVFAHEAELDSWLATSAAALRLRARATVASKRAVIQRGYTGETIRLNEQEV